MEEEDSGASGSEHVIEALRDRGWCFRELEQLKAIIIIHSALADDDARALVDSVESELANMDLRTIGGKSLPELSILRKSPHLSGPIVLQISTVRDISRSSIEGFSNSSGSRRLFRLGLTDGFTELTAIEYSNILSISDDIVPGTKVRIENKVAIHSGIVCLNSKVFTVIGGVVPSLHEEWQMNKKYSGFSRSSLRLSLESDGSGPPPFEKLQIGLPKRQLVQQDFSGSSSRHSGPTLVDRNIDIRPTSGQGNLHSMDSKLKSASIVERTEERPSTSETRPKEVVESVPVQNQAAAQKLLQKMNHPSQNDRHYKGRRGRGKEKNEEPSVFTLDEWEKRKAGVKPIIAAEVQDISQDEDLAWQLQNKIDLEDANVQRGHDGEAEDIRMSMFNYNRDDNGSRGVGREGRGRGRGSGRRWGRGKARGRGRGGS